ncbi:hypothetical protein GGS23DRAFT_617725 [Durotheca rogersii]|uniref:uncharacterized protein n=1 Tax=Durotheca rogersii TaxID=419775 RepID=UPI002220B03B|nr:uncharacterized protein GGS23DRAFT_617725 [Durotheca rogersii]KAI5856687.1 hypothetical protein GGS23DRAFT_617725 [Durotheca rogersii]
MPRKGSSKVRTGCLTCKARKVKCDEGKPCCQRCVSTGRKCDGYAAAASSLGLSWHRPRHLFPNIDDQAERRALQFFCDAAGPSLSGPLNPYFWTHLVVQFSTFEPAVRHSVVAISSLYEQLYANPGSAPPLTPNTLALTHYNSAIRELKAMRNEPLVLLVCVLFICIEILMANRDTAIQHCKHGVSILENVEASYPWTKEYLSPIFRRLTLFPFFFGKDHTSFPRLVGLEDRIAVPFRSIGEAQYYVDGLVARTVRLVRRADIFRLGDLRHCPVPPELLLEQNKIRGLIGDWRRRFSDFQSLESGPRKPDAALYNVTLRFEIAYIWAEVAFDQDETAYDKFLGRFRWMVSQAAELLASRESSGRGESRKMPHFTFEMGFVPLLYYVVLKCRCLTTRVQALSLIKQLGAPRENLWEVSAVHASARRVVEIEHGVVLDEADQPSGPARWPDLPPDEVRVRDSTMDRQATVHTEVRGRMVGFFRRTTEGNIYVQREYVVETT